MDHPIYAKESQGKVFSPFQICVEDMQQLMLINFEKDPDEIYLGFEPQYLGIGATRALRVIGWRNDGYVDVYQQPALPLEYNNLDVAGKGLKEIVHRPMQNARFEITPLGVDVYFQFSDTSGRKVEVTVKENCGKKTKPFTVLAPAGSSSASPSALPVFLLYDFYFVRYEKTDVSISIGDKKYQADGFPLPIDGTKIYFMRYSKDPLIVNFCPAYTGHMPVLEQNGQSYLGEKGNTYALEINNGWKEIKQIHAQNKNHRVDVCFDPPFPELLCLKDDAACKGAFSITSDTSAGKVGGVYTVNREDKQINITLHPCKGWKPHRPRLMPAIIFTVAKIFKTWPKTYQWECIIDLTAESKPSMRTAWKRVEAK